MRLGKALKSFSAFTRPESELVHKTVHGAVVTILGTLLACVLLVSEVHQYIYAPPEHEMSVSTERQPLIRIGIDVTLHALPCSLVSVDTIDATGGAETDQYNSVHHMRLHKQRLDATGRRIGHGDYNAPRPDIITIVAGTMVADSLKHVEEMEQELRDGEGCHVFGELEVKRLAGAMRLTVHMRDWMQLRATQAEINVATAAAAAHATPGGAITVHSDFSRANVSHTIGSFAFGPPFPGRVNPLDGFSRTVTHDYGTYEYYMKVVPTTYISAMWRRTESNTYSVAEYFVPGARAPAPGATNVERVPALEFHYEFSPLAVRIWWPRRGVGPIAVRLCAVVGGCFALTRWLDGVVHAAARALRGA